MKLLKTDFRLGFCSFLVESADDLWVLHQIIDREDTLKGKTERKIKVGDNQAKVIKKTITIAVTVEKVELTDTALRVSGLILEGPDDIPHGVHHTISIEENLQYTLTKKTWLNYHKQKLEEAQNQTKLNILAVLFDREEAFIYKITNQKTLLLTKLKGNVAKKQNDQVQTANFYKEIVKTLEEYDKQYNPQNIIIGSASFWKDYLLKALTENLKNKAISANISDLSDTSIDELLKRPELKVVLEKSKEAKEDNIIDEFLKALAKEKAAYGTDDIINAINENNISIFLITETAIAKHREDNSFKKIEEMMSQIENANGHVHIIETHNAKQKIDALGGIVIQKRW